MFIDLNKTTIKKSLKIKTMKSKINFMQLKTIMSFSSRLFVALLAASFLVLTSFTNDDLINAKTVSNLKHEYATAENVKWETTSDYTKASFTWNHQQLEVFYNKEGERIAESKAITIEDLPLNAQHFISKKYAAYKTIEAIEFYSEESGLCYYVSIVKDASKKILKITSDGYVSLFRPK